jgi:hypothetical protein
VPIAPWCDSIITAAALPDGAAALPPAAFVGPPPELVLLLAQALANNATASAAPVKPRTRGAAAFMIESSPRCAWSGTVHHASRR